MSRKTSWFMTVGMLMLILPHYSFIPIVDFVNLHIDVVSEIVWYFQNGNVEYVISLREVLSYLRWLPLILMVIYVVWIVINRRMLTRSVYKADKYAIVFLSFSVISCIYSIDPRMTLLRSASLWLMYLAVFWGVWFFVDIFGVESIIRVILNTASIVFVVHIFFAVMYPQVAFPYLGRFEGWTINPGTVAGYSAVVLPLALCFALKSSKITHWLLVSAIVVVLIMSQTRTELIASMCGSLFFLLFVLPNKRLVSVVLVSCVFLVATIWIQFGSVLFPQGTEFSWNRLFVFESVYENKSDDLTFLEKLSIGTTDESLFISDDIQDLENIDESLFVGDNTQDLENKDVLIPEDMSQSTEKVDRDSSNQIGTITNIRTLRRDNPRIQHITTLSSRTEKWMAGLQYLIQRPLLGYGFGTEDKLFAYHGVQENLYVRTGSYLHNAYLGLALQLGLIGALLLYLPLLILFVNTVRISINFSTDDFNIACLSVLLVGMISAVASSDIYSMGNSKSVPFWISVMLLVRYNLDAKFVKKITFE